MTDRTLALLYTRLGSSVLWLILAWAAVVGATVYGVVGLTGSQYLGDPSAMLIACGGWLAIDVLIAVPVVRRAWPDLAPALA
ncbi:MAG: hypothetical protein AB7G37_07715, partial [Solirubrobacteraceae bacterium]